MEKLEFDDYFKVLDKASDRLRTVIYAFIIVFVAMLIYAVNAFAYPVRQFTYDYVNQEARCFFADFPGDTCAQAKADFEAHKITPDMRSEINLSLWEHQLQGLYDDSVKLRTFSFPVFGLETDRDLLWLLFPLVGVIGYYIVLLSLGSMIRLFEFLRENNPNDPYRLRMIQSTLVITAPLETRSSKTATISRRGQLGPLFKSLWRVFAFGVFFIPIFVSLLMIIDQTNAVAALVLHKPGEYFLHAPTNLFEIQLAVEVLLVLFQAGLFVALVQLGRVFGKCQEEVEMQIPIAERTNQKSL